MGAMRNAGRSYALPLRFCGVMKAWKADVSLLRLGDSKPLRSPRGDYTSKEVHVRALYLTRSSQNILKDLVHNWCPCRCDSFHIYSQGG